MVVSAALAGSVTITIPDTNFTIAGSTADVAVPTLTSITVAGSPATAGQTVSIGYQADDASRSLGAVRVTFLDRYQIARTFTASGTGSFPLSGVIDQVIPASWPNGTYTLSSVALTDRYGNLGRYQADGSVLHTPEGTTGPSSHAVDFQAVTFWVSGSTADFPPVLTSLGLTGSPGRSPGRMSACMTPQETASPIT